MFEWHKNAELTAALFFSKLLKREAIKTGSSLIILCFISSRTCEICFLVSLPAALKACVEVCRSREGGGAVVQMAAHLFVLLFYFLNSGFLNINKKQPRDQGLSAERAGEE